MIFDILLDSISGLLTLVFGILPNLPPMPQVVVDAGSMAIGWAANVSGLLKYLFSPVLFPLIITLITGLLLFEQIYHFVMWIIKKLPISSS